MTSQPEDGRKWADYCPHCGQSVALRKDWTFRKHGPKHACPGNGKVSQERPER
jgi:predicted RNA-binding Zn-ribbon protein involved in translation (DUF1610 family)